MSDVANILALDLATNFGWSKLFLGTIKSSSYRLPSTGPDVGRFLCAYEDWALEHFPGMDLIVYEAPIMIIRSEKDGGGLGNDPIVTEKLMGLVCETQRIAHRLGIRCVKEYASRVRKHFLGSARGKTKELKARVVAECHARGWMVKDDDEADSRALMDFAMHVYKVEGAQAGPLFKGPAP